MKTARDVSLARDMPTGPFLCLYQILSLASLAQLDARPIGDQ